MQQGRFADAQTTLQTLLDKNQGDIEALYCQAVCHRKTEHFEQAEQNLKALLNIDSQHSHAVQEQGHLMLAMGEIEKAAYIYSKAVDLNPALHGAWRALSQLTNHPRAFEAKRHVAWLDSLPPELVSTASFIHQGKLQKAEALCRQFLAKQPHHPEAMRLLAQLGVKFHILDDAELLLRRCIELEPKHLQARLDLVDVLQRRQKFPEALEQAQELYRLDPSNPGFEISLGNALQATGDYSGAASRYRNAIEQANTKLKGAAKRSDHASVYVALGNTLKTAGNTDEAVLAYQTAYQMQASYGDAYWSLANLKTYHFDEAELQKMQAQLQLDQVGDLDRARTHFALGKAYEDAGKFDDSFHHYQQGNQIKAREQSFDLPRLQAELKHQRSHFDADFFSQRQHFGCQYADPIFIVGLPRAGSTLLEQILASHSQVDGTMELANIIAYAHRFNGRSAAVDKPKYPAVLDKLTAEQATALGETYIKETQAHRQGAAFFIDKMPNNFRHIALIKLILPNAKIIDARRDPMACCFSGYKQLFAEGQEFSYSLSDIGNYYCEYVRVMEHWQRTLPGQILHVQHEDVIDDLEGQVRRILDFCGLGFEQTCIDFHKSKRAVRTPSSEQVRQPIFKTAMQQWRNYEAHLGPLMEILRGLN